MMSRYDPSLSVVFFWIALFLALVYITVAY